MKTEFIQLIILCLILYTIHPTKIKYYENAIQSNRYEKINIQNNIKITTGLISNRSISFIFLPLKYF